MHSVEFFVGTGSVFLVIVALCSRYTLTFYFYPFTETKIPPTHVHVVAYKNRPRQKSTEPPVAAAPGKNPSGRLHRGYFCVDTFCRHFYLPSAVERPPDRAETFRSTNSKNKSVTDRNSWMTFRCRIQHQQLYNYLFVCNTTTVVLCVWRTTENPRVNKSRTDEAFQSSGDQEKPQHCHYFPICGILFSIQFLWWLCRLHQAEILGDNWVDAASSQYCPLCAEFPNNKRQKF